LVAAWPNETAAAVGPRLSSGAPRETRHAAKPNFFSAAYRVAFSTGTSSGMGHRRMRLDKIEIQRFRNFTDAQTMQVEPHGPGVVPA
jgi:hypothetical protein